MIDRQLDIAVAKLLGLEVLGEAPCWQDLHGNWFVPSSDFGETLPVYLKHCRCSKTNMIDDILYFDHSPACLGVVSFYTQKPALAIQALEQICDKRTLVASLTRTFGGVWIVELYTARGDRIARDRSKESPLAICKALAEMGEQNETKNKA